MKKILLLSLVMLVASMLVAETVSLNNGSNAINVISSSNSQTVIDYTVSNFEKTNIEINGEVYNQLKLNGFANMIDTGKPELPKISRSIIIPNAAKMDVRVIDGDYVEFDMNIAPSKGNLIRTVNPEDVPFSFGNVYNENAFYPAKLATLSSPYIMRDFRGIVVNVNPFQFNPVTNILRVYTNIRVEVNNVGMGTENIKFRNSNAEVSTFSEIYETHFLNYQTNRYEEMNEEGRLVVICADEFATAIQPFVDWKIQKGIPTDLYLKSEIGTTANAIQSFIQNIYDTTDDLTFVQLVGDSSQIPTLYNSGDSDPSYALLEGSDSYPEIFIGRFSAQTTAQVDTQVERVVHYERDIADGAWLAKGFGIGSTQGDGTGDDGEADWVHINNIKADLMDYTYTEVSELYEGSQGGEDAPGNPSPSTVAAALNDGRGFGNYCGHGSMTSWVSSGFSNSDVNNLSNTNMLPFICSVACVNGDFVGNTCFAEAWLRATDSDGNPTGAIAMYASTINQSWAPPMSAQDEVTDLLVADAKHTIGGLFYSGSCLMIDEYGTGGADMFNTWHIFGDPTLMVRTAEPTAFVIPAEINMLVGMDAIDFNIGEIGAKATVMENGVVLATAVSDDSGNINLNFTEPVSNVGDLLLTITGFNKITEQAFISVIPAEGPYVVVDEFVITDNDNNIVENGDNIFIDVAYGNVGVETATECSAVISMIENPYFTIVSNTTTIGDIAAESVTNAEDQFEIAIAPNAPNQTTGEFIITVTSGDSTWENTIYVTINAPEPDFTSITVNDSGNSNGILEPGETATLSIGVANIGNAPLNNVVAEIICDNELVIVSGNIQTLPEVLPNNELVVSFEVEASAELEIGTSITFGLYGESDNYSFFKRYVASIGQVSEDFESNGFSSFEWTFATGNEWLISSDAYEGNYSAQSNDIDANQVTTMSIIIDNPSPSQVSFARKISTEHNYDYYSFKVNGTEMESLSGAIAWEEVSFDIPVGQLELVWEYEKDYAVDSDDDCIWIDNITFPGVSSSNAPIIFVTEETIDFGEVELNQTASANFSIINFGSETMTGTISTPANFSIEADNRNEISYSIEAECSQEFVLSFTPTEEGTVSGTVEITSNDVNTQILVSGETTDNDDNNVEPLVTVLKGNYPNPFNPITFINFSIETEGKVQIDVYNILGQKVKTLVNEHLQSGSHQIKWNGKDDSNNSVASGVYFYKMKNGRYTSTKKMLMLK